MGVGCRMYRQPTPISCILFGDRWRNGRYVLCIRAGKELLRVGLGLGNLVVGDIGTVEVDE